MWLDGLRQDETLARQLGLDWLGEEQGRLWSEQWKTSWAAAPWEPQFVERGLNLPERCRVVAQGPTRQRRTSAGGSILLLVHDPERDELALLPSTAFPPFGMPYAGRTPASLRAAFADYAREPWAVPSLPRTLRVLKPLEIESVDIVLHTIEGTEPWMDDGLWGSAHDGDPYDELPAQPGPVDLMLIGRRALEQHPGRPPTWSMRSLWSRSVLRIEQHPYGLWVFEVRYQPVQTDLQAPERLTSSLAFPPDLPVDVLPSLLRGETLVPSALELLSLQGEPDPFYLAGACALATGDPGICAQIERLAARFVGSEHEHVAAEILSNYAHHVALARLGLASPTAREPVEQLLALSPQEAS
jgi:hypothetical protein